ncbi:hypothetical protein Scep_014774 [Stephania cephalantha]|uniref:Reverse transcriptase Ty1/copia-type domain-containing protein n=1 Tax=Stephania cephalantha TaxID=152367 RepID=A0AAP0J3T5_9MAGN
MQEAMKQEIEALYRNHTWSLVPPSNTQQVVGTKCIFKIKRNSDGIIYKHKARLVVKGYKQQPGIDFHETYSPVIKSSTVRIILTLATSYNWPLKQLDVNNAFLHGNLSEKVFIPQPTGFTDPFAPHHVCYLHKVLYGLQQAPRAWFDKFRNTFLHWGFRNSATDYSLFIHKHGNSVTYLLIFVEDIIVIGNSSTFINSFISSLYKQFAH